MIRHDALDTHLSGLAAALLPYRREAERLANWGTELAWTLARGGRLLVAGNGGSAAEAQHLTAELVGKLRDDREPLSAIALHAETSALTAIGNDYGYDEVFARQVRAHGRPDDILLLISTSGTSTNLLTAARAGRDTGLRCWAFTGPTPNPLAELCHDVLAVPSPDSQVVQELHLVSTHLLCEYVDQALPLIRQLPTAPAPIPGSGGARRWTPPAAPEAVPGDGPGDGRRQDGADRDGRDDLVLARLPGQRGRNGQRHPGPENAGSNGHGPNGRRVDGRGLDGLGIDDHPLNGHGSPGHRANGHTPNGHTPNGHGYGSTGTGWVQP